MPVPPPNFCYGRIVHVRSAVPDPQGRNPKAGRPFVVLTPPKEIEAADSLLIIAISHEVGDDVDYAVELPWGRGCSTGFTEPGSFAICNWHRDHPKSDLDVKASFIKPKELYQIETKYRHWLESSGYC